MSFKKTTKNVYKKLIKSRQVSRVSIYYTRKSIISSCNNNEFKISGPTWNDKFELPDGSCSVSDIQETILSRF